MKTPETSQLFEKRVNEASGVEYYVLTAKVADYQQGFYFVNNSMTNDGRYLWFYCSFPPVYSSELRKLGVIDFEMDEIYLLNDTLCNAASPYIDSETGCAYFTWKNGIYKRSPAKDDHTLRLASLDNKAFVERISTHLTLSPDKAEFFLDVREGNRNFYVGSLNLETGKFTKWAENKHQFNHAQFNPVYPDLALCAYDAFKDQITGERQNVPKDENGVYQRLWTVTRNGEKTCYKAEGNYATHEWWSPDGRFIYYVNGSGIHKLNIETLEDINVHPCVPWHAHVNRDESCYVYDKVEYDRYETWYRGMPASVKFYNSMTDREIDIVSLMPSNEFHPGNQCRYHIDPHPRFTENEKYIVFTTTELGGADVAVVKVEQLITMTGGRK